MILDKLDNDSLEGDNMESIQREIDAIDQMENSIPKIFGLKSEKLQNALMHGRHPKSLPKKSELWHYWKLSCDRTERIQKGHKFWNVLQEENVLKKYPHDRDHDRKVAEQLDAQSSEFNIPAQGSNKSGKTRKSTSGMKANSLEEIQVKVDFKRKSQINFGMTFIITNYLDEILYVNKHGELRCKSMNALSSSDKIKFKLVDLANPTNPGALQYGTPMWLQSIDINEALDHSFHNGYVLTSKLFGPPQLKAVQFDMPANLTEPTAVPTNTNNSYTARPTLIAAATDDSAVTNNEGGIALSPDRDTPSQRAGDESAVNSPDREALKQRGKPRLVSRDSFSADNKDTAKELERRQKLESNSANVCGSMGISRILEPKRGEMNYENMMERAVASDEKNSRVYNTKQAMLLGKWTIHSGMREELVRTAGKVEQLSKKDDKFVMSLSPIVIQQDLYCVSTTSSSEFHNWPKNSDSIVDDDKKRKRQKKTNQPGAARPTSATPSKPEPKAKGNLLSTLNNMENATNHSSSTSIGPNGHSHQDEYDDEEEDTGDYGCIRKVVSRGFPYDFSVDRRCVWKFCLFEQFTGETVNSRSSDKERISQRVMEAATMVLKRSKLNREGSRVHNTGFSGDLPPLKGGETFPKTLRFIVQKRTLKSETEMLNERRVKEVNLKSYISLKIDDVLSAADSDEALHNKGVSSSKSVPGGDGGSVATKNSIGSSSSNVFFTDSDSLTQSSSTAKAGKGGSVTFAAFESGPLVKSSASMGSLSTSNKNSHSSFSNQVLKSSVHSSSFMKMYGQHIIGQSSSHGELPVRSPPFPGSRSSNMESRSRVNSPDANIMESPVAEKPVLREENSLSREIQATFKSDARRLESRHLLLNRTDGSNHYDRLSAGEKVLALHKTFNHLRKVTESEFESQLNGGLSAVRTPKFGNRTKANVDWAMVAHRQSQMAEEDNRIKSVLNYKDRKEKERAMSELIRIEK